MLVSSSKKGCGSCNHKNTSNGVGCLGCPFSREGLGQTDISSTDMSFLPIQTPTLSNDLNAAFNIGGDMGIALPPDTSSSFNSSGLLNLFGNIGNSLTRLFGPQPNLIQGTNVIYDPNTGRMIPASGVGLNTAVGSFFSTPSGGISWTTILLIGGVIFLATRK